MTRHPAPDRPPVKVQILSDLHVDVAPYTHVAAPGAGIVLVAGDVCERLSERALVWLAAEVKSRDVEVVYVPGNHDYWRTNITTELARARQAAAELGIHLLAEGEAVIIHGVKIIGATLWTDYAISGWPERAMHDAATSMNDHRKIRIGPRYRRFTPYVVRSVHIRQKANIEAELSQPHDGPTLVVSHHAPHPKSLMHGEVREVIDAAYASDLTDLIQQHQPDLWVHGHIHKSHDYQVGATRVICNPRGYVIEKKFGPSVAKGEENPHFDPVLVVTVS